MPNELIQQDDKLMQREKEKAQTLKAFSGLMAHRSDGLRHCIETIAAQG